MPNAITAIFGANSAQFKTELAAMQAAAIATGRGITSGLGGGGHGPQGMTGIIRESTVIAREISMGRGTGRILGSLSLLIQYLRSFVTGTKAAGAASEVLADKMELEALRAQVAAYKSKQLALATDEAAAALSYESEASNAAAVAAARKSIVDGEAAVAANDKAVATRLAADMEKLEAAVSGEAAAKAAAASVVFFAVTAAIIATAVAAFLLYKHFKLIREEAKNLKDLLGPITQDFRAHADALRDAAKIEVDYLEHLKRIGEETESLPQKLEAVIKKLHEQTEAQIELMRAQGGTAVQIEALKEQEIQSEIDLTKAAIDRAAADSAAAKADYAAKEKAYKEGASHADVLKSASDKASEAGDVLSAVQKAHDTMVGQSVLYNTGQMTTDQFGGQRPIQSTRTVGENDKFSVEVGGKPFSITLAEARKYYDKLAGDASDLAAAQEQLKKDYDDAGTTLEQRTKDQEKLAKTEQDYKDQLEIAKKYGGPAAAAEDAKKTARGDRASGYGLNAQQRIGAYAATPVAMQQLNELKEIKNNTKQPKANNNRPPGTRPPHLGGTVDRGTYGHHQD